MADGNELSFVKVAKFELCNLAEISYVSYVICILYIIYDIFMTCISYFLVFEPSHIICIHM